MDIRIKKSIMFIVFVLFVVAVAAALYFVFFRPTDVTPPQVVTTDEDTGAFPLADEGPPLPLTTDEDIEIVLPVSDVAIGGVTRITSLTEGAVSMATLGRDGQSMNFYDRSDGKFYTVSADGTVTALSDQAFPLADDVAWNKDANKALVEFPDGTNIIYDFDTKEQITLPTHWEEFQFSPTSDEVIAKSIGLDPSNRWLVITNDDGTNTQTVAALGANADKVDVSWSPNDHVVAFSDTGPDQSGFGRNMILPVGKSGENFKGLIVEGFDYQNIWSTSGDRILYSVYSSASDYNPSLWIVDGSGDDIGNNRQNLGIQTWAEKCTFYDNTTIYCAVPDTLPKGSGLQASTATNQADSIYRINASTGSVTFVGEPEIPQTMNDITISEDGKYLYYVDNLSGQLKSMRLK